MTQEIINHLHTLANPDIASHSQRFFKTKKGEYGEGDLFLGIRVPVLRKLAKSYPNLTVDEICILLRSPWHEIRLFSLILLVNLYQKKRSSTELKEQIFQTYLAQSQYINNWDLVDISAHKIVGPHLALNEEGLGCLHRLASSPLLWDRRIAMISCFYFIQQEIHSAWVLDIATRLVNDPHDLIQKAVGWMLRELGKRNPHLLFSFLDSHGTTMPRTALRYSIERLSTSQRTHYLGLKDQLKYAEKKTKSKKGK